MNSYICKQFRAAFKGTEWNTPNSRSQAFLEMIRYINKEGKYCTRGLCLGIFFQFDGKMLYVSCMPHKNWNLGENSDALC